MICRDSYRFGYSLDTSFNIDRFAHNVLDVLKAWYVEEER